MDAVYAKVVEALTPKYLESLGEEEFDFMMKMGWDKAVQKAVRDNILYKGKRMDGRGVRELRPLSAEVDVLPVVHGSALFRRGETQALVIATLGGPQDVEEIDMVTQNKNIEKKLEDLKRQNAERNSEAIDQMDRAMKDLLADLEQQIPQMVEQAYNRIYSKEDK